MSNIHDILTDREIEVLRLASSGKKDWQVAESLKVSTSTITTYWYRIKMKLSVRSRSEAIAHFATSRVSSFDTWTEPSDNVSHRASSRQWSELGAPFVSFVIDMNGRFKTGAGSVMRYIGTGGKPPSDDEWNRFISQVVGAEGLEELSKTGHFRGKATVGNWTFEVYALVSNALSASSNSVSVTAIDITDHVKLQDELKEGKDYFRSVLDQAPNMYFIWDFKLGYLTYVNHFAHHVLGYSIEQLRSMGWSVFDLIHPDDNEAAMARISLISHMRKGEILTMPLRVKTREGAYVSFNTVATPFSVNDDGSVREFLCACFDIASYHEQLDHLEVEHKLMLERYNALRLSIKHSPIGLMTIDMEARVLSINPEGLKLVGADRDGWLDVYDAQLSMPLSERTLLQLHQDWLSDDILKIKPSDIRVVQAHDCLGNLRRYMLSPVPVRDCQGAIVKYTMTFYSFESIMASLDYVKAIVDAEAKSVIGS